MMHDRRLHYSPRTGSLETDTPDILIPALSGLRPCRDSIDTLVYIESLPDLLLPALAWEASRKPFIPRVATHTLVKYCGALCLRQRLGARKAAQLLARYPLRETASSL